MNQTMTRATGIDWPTIWAAARERMRRDLGDAVFDAWISSLSLVEYDNGEIKIGAPRPFARNWVANQYVARIERALRAEGGEPASVSIVLAAQKAAIPATPRAPESHQDGAPVSRLNSSERDKPGEPRRVLNSRMLDPMQTFETFVSGPSNEFGFRAARAIAEGDESGVALLYIHGGFGNGKTHLLNAIALEARKRGRRALLLGAEDFMRQFLGALKYKDTLGFKDELRAADMLMIDDLQHLCRSTYTVSFGSDPDKVAAASAIVVQDLKQMQQAPVSDSDLKRAKGILLRQIPLGESSFGAIGNQLLMLSIEDKPLDAMTIAGQHYLKLTAPEVQQAYAKHVRPDAFVTAVKGPAPKG